MKTNYPEIEVGTVWVADGNWCPSDFYSQRADKVVVSRMYHTTISPGMRMILFVYVDGSEYSLNEDKFRRLYRLVLPNV